MNSTPITNRQIKKNVLILFVFAFIAGSCTQATKKQPQIQTQPQTTNDITNVHDSIYSIIYSYQKESHYTGLLTRLKNDSLNVAKIEELKINNYTLVIVDFIFPYESGYFVANEKTNPNSNNKRYN